MSTKVISFDPISSDSNMFDYELIIRRTKAAMQLNDQKWLELVREHFSKKFPHMSDVERSTAVALFMTTEMDFKHFAATLDILKVKIQFNLNVPDLKPSA